MKVFKSTFALLDVDVGRKDLSKRIMAGEEVPVVLSGVIHNQWGQDDGTSTEFEVRITSVFEGTSKPLDVADPIHAASLALFKAEEERGKSADDPQKTSAARVACARAKRQLMEAVVEAAQRAGHRKPI